MAVKKVAFVHILSSLFSCSVSLLGQCFCPPPPPSHHCYFHKCHSSLLLRPPQWRTCFRESERDREKRNSCLLTCASEKHRNKEAVSEAAALFPPLFLFFSSLCTFVKGAVVSSSGYLYILFREKRRWGYRSV